MRILYNSHCPRLTNIQPVNTLQCFLNVRHGLFFEYSCLKMSGSFKGKNYVNWPLHQETRTVTFHIGIGLSKRFQSWYSDIARSSKYQRDVIKDFRIVFGVWDVVIVLSKEIGGKISLIEYVLISCLKIAIACAMLKLQKKT